MSHHSAVRLYATFACTLLLSLAARPVHAQFTPRALNDPATGERYHIEGAAALWFPGIDLTVNSEEFGIAGSEIDFKKDLGAEDHKIGDLRLVLRPTKRSKFRFEYIPIHYDSTTILQRRIVFNGIAYNVGLPVNSTLDWKAYRFIYEYDVASFNRWYAGFILEAKYTDIAVKLASPIDVETATAQAPVPSLGGVGRVYIVPNISATVEITGMKLPDNVIKRTFAHYLDVDIYGTVNFNDHLGAQFGYRSLDVGVTVKSDVANACGVSVTAGLTGTSGCFKLSGPYIGVVARY
jgi:hypothetical protein